MTKDIKDYLHLYLGCQVLIDGETLVTLVGFSHTYDIELYVNNQWLHHRFCKLLLRPLSDMTDEEMDEVWYGPSERTRYLLSKGFDLFGLIEAGLAIDATTLKQKA